MFRFSIKTKLSIFALLLSVVFGVFISMAIFLYLDNTLVSGQIENTKMVAKEQIHESLSNFRQYQLFSKMLGTRTRVLEYLQDQSETRREELDGIFNDYAREDLNILSIYLIDKNGNTLISTDKSFVGQNYAFREYFKESIQGKSFVSAALGKTSNKFGYYFSHPVVTKDGLVLGVLITKVDALFLEKPILDSELSVNNTIMLTDDLGVVIMSNKTERFLHSLGSLSELENIKIKSEDRFLNKEIQPLQYGLVQDVIRNYKVPQSVEFLDEIDDEQESVYVQKMGDLSFFFAVEISLDDAEKIVFNAIFIISTIVLMMALLVALLGYLLINHFFIKPFKEFSDDADRIANGDFSYRIKVNTNDELQDLAKAMNSMSDKLGNYYEDLDKQVKNKTIEIEKKNEKLAKQQRAVLNILEDVEKEKKKAEGLANDLEKFKLAVDNASDHIVITDAEGVVVYGNKAVQRITGYKSEEALGKKAGVLWSIPMPLDYYKKLWDTIKVKKQTFVGEIQNRRKNGEIYTAIISISPVLDEKDNIVFFVGIERDITKEKEIDKTKTEFVSLASHQLRTPLSTINWYSEMLINGDAGKLKPEQQQYLEEIYRGNQRMVKLVNALLNVSRLELGTFMIEPKKCDIKKIADEAIDDLEHKMNEKQIKFSKKYDKKIKDMMLDDKLTMIIFQNLLSNAVKYTPDKGKIDLSITIDGKKLLIVVKDTGMGIPKNQQDKIFTKLFRADNVRKTDTEGTGLGLYIIKSVVENVGGKIWFDSGENKGTKFYVTLPLSGMKQKAGNKSLA